MGDYYRSGYPYQKKPTLGGSSSSASLLNHWPRHINWPLVQNSGNVSKCANSLSSFNSATLVYRDTEVNPEVSQFSGGDRRYSFKHGQNNFDEALAASSPAQFLPQSPTPLLEYPQMEERGTNLQSQYRTLLPLPDEQRYDDHEDGAPMYSNIRHNDQMQPTGKYQLPNRARTITQKYPSSMAENQARWDAGGKRNDSKKTFTNQSDKRIFDRKINATFREEADFHENQYRDQQGSHFYESANYSYTERGPDQYKSDPFDPNDQDADYYTDISRYWQENDNYPDAEDQYHDSIDNNFANYEDMAGKNNVAYHGQKIGVDMNLGFINQRPKYPTHDNQLESMGAPMNPYPGEFVSIQGQDVSNEVIFQGRVKRPNQEASNEIKRKAVLKSGQFHPNEGKQRQENTSVLHSERNFDPDSKQFAVFESVEPIKNAFSLMGSGQVFQSASERVSLLPTPVAGKTLLGNPHSRGQHTPSRHDLSPPVGFPSLGKYDEAEFPPKNHGKDGLSIDWTMLSKAVEAASNVSNLSQTASKEESSSQTLYKQFGGKMFKKEMTSEGNSLVTSDKAAELLQTWECLMSGVEIPLERSIEIRPEPDLETKAIKKSSWSTSSFRSTLQNRSLSPGRRRSSNRISSRINSESRSVRLDKSKSRKHRSPSGNINLIESSRCYRSIEASKNRRIAHSPRRSLSNGKRSRSPERMFDRKFNERHIDLMTDDIDSMPSRLGVRSTNYRKTRRSTSLETLRRDSTDIRNYSLTKLGSPHKHYGGRRKRHHESVERRRLRSKSRPLRSHRSSRRKSRRSKSRVTAVMTFSPSPIGANCSGSPLREVRNQSPSSVIFQMRSRSVTPVKIVHEDELELTVKSRIRSQSPLFSRLGRDSSHLRMSEPKQIPNHDLRWRLKSLENRDYSPVSDEDHSPAHSFLGQGDLRHVLLRRLSPGPETVPVRIEKLSRSRTRSNSPDLAHRKYLSFVPSPPPGWLPRPVPRNLNGSPKRQRRPWSPVPVTAERSSNVETDPPGLLFEAKEGREPLHNSFEDVAHRSTEARNRRPRNKKRGRRVSTSSEDEVSPSRRAKLWLDVIESTSKMQPTSRSSSTNVCTVNAPFATHLAIPPPGLRPPNHSFSPFGPQH